MRFSKHDIQIRMRRPGNVNIFQWSRECFFLRHEELNSRSIVMTIDEVTLDRPKIGQGFSAICGFCQLNLSRFTMKFSAEIFAPYGWFPPWSGFSEFVVSSWQFWCTIYKWEHEFNNFLFRDDSSKINIWRIQLFQIFQVCYQNISFPNSSHDQLIAKKDSCLYFLAKLMNSCLIFREVGWYSTIAPKAMIGPLNGFQNRLS